MMANLGLLVLGILLSVSALGATTDNKKKCEALLTSSERPSSEEQEMRTDATVTAKPDGIYGKSGTLAMEHVAVENGLRRETDQNIFDWYGGVMPLSLDANHVIDWGAGVGRFAAFFAARGARRITLVEPSSESFSALENRFASSTSVELIRGEIGVGVARIAEEKDTLHVCNFVVNCIGSLKTAFDALARSVRPGERLFLVTNVFAPRAVVEAIRDSRSESAVAIDISVEPPRDLNLPVSRVFSNEIIGSGETLKDSVHTLADYAHLWKEVGSQWNALNAKLLLPDGFRHKVMPGENFGDYRFAVLVMELVRR